MVALTDQWYMRYGDPAWKAQVPCARARRVFACVVEWEGGARACLRVVAFLSEVLNPCAFRASEASARGVCGAQLLHYITVEVLDYITV